MGKSFFSNRTNFNNSRTNTSCLKGVYDFKDCTCFFSSTIIWSEIANAVNHYYILVVLAYYELNYDTNYNDNYNNSIILL